MSDRIWPFGVIGITVIAAILRLYDLSLVPLHHDEGVNGNFLMRLVREGAYRTILRITMAQLSITFRRSFPGPRSCCSALQASETYGLTTFNDPSGDRRSLGLRRSVSSFCFVNNSELLRPSRRDLCSRFLQAPSISRDITFTRVSLFFSL